MGLPEQCFLEKSSGTIMTGQEWLNQGIAAQALATSGNWVAVPCAETDQGKETVRREFRIGNNNGIGMKEIVLLLFFLKLSKTPEGLKVIRDWGIQALKTLGDSMDALGKASAANPITAWANPYLLSIIYERFGIVPSERMAEFRIGLSIISGAEVGEDIIKALSGFRFISIGESRKVAEEFPQDLDMGDKIEYNFFRREFGFGGKPLETKREKKKK